MLIAQCNAYRILKQPAFTLVPYETSLSTVRFCLLGKGRLTGDPFPS